MCNVYIPQSNTEENDKFMPKNTNAHIPPNQVYKWWQQKSGKHWIATFALLFNLLIF